MKIYFHNPKEGKKNYDVAVLFIKHQMSDSSLHPFPPILKKILKDRLFSGKKNENLFLPYTPIKKAKHLLLIGLGNDQQQGHQNLRNACGLAYRILKQKKMTSAGIDLSLIDSTHSHETLRAIGEGFSLAKYSFNDFQKQSASEKHKVSEILLLTSGQSISKKITQKAEQTNSLKEALVLAEATNFARWLADHPGNRMTPAILAEQVRKKAQNTSLKVTIWNKDKITKEKMGGLLGVSLGSHQEPRFIIMEYQGAKPSVKPVCFVGKGLTFDCGGISIKPAHNMHEMKFDMCGGTAVIGTMLALSKMKSKVNVIGLVPASENMPGANANKPGDILKARNGKTMEVLNTDAEGRLILADALSYASEQKVQAIFDAATLTGAMVVALGNSHTGFFTRNQELRKRIEKCAEKSGETVWAMPLIDDHVSDIKSSCADVANISTGGRGAGSATAAAFLEHFVNKNIPWAHFDIAGTAWNVSNRLNYCNKDEASGVMVRTFYELAQTYT